MLLCLSVTVAIYQHSG